MIAVCVDDRGGMLFNHRRLSRDRAQREDLLELCGGRRLWVSPYTAPLFAGQADVAVDEEFLAKAGAGEFCFVEDRALRPFADRIESVVLYRWNRAYPADVHLDLDPAAEGFVLTELAEFAGTSHEKITREIYKRRENHG